MKCAFWSKQESLQPGSARVEMKECNHAEVACLGGSCGFVFKRSFLKMLGLCHISGSTGCSWPKWGAQLKRFDRNLRWPELEKLNSTPDTKRWSNTSRNNVPQQLSGPGTHRSLQFPESQSQKKQFCAYLAEYLYSTYTYAISISLIYSSQQRLGGPTWTGDLMNILQTDIRLRYLNIS